MNANLPTIAEFQRRVSRTQRALLTTVAATLAIAFVLVGAMSLMPLWLLRLAFFPTVVALFGAFIVANAVVVRLKFSAMLCPHCRIPMLPNAPAIIASRRCVRCGNQVMADRETAVPSESLIPLAHFSQAAGIWCARVLRALGVGTIAAYLGGLPLCLLTGRGANWFLAVGWLALWVLATTSALQLVYRRMRRDHRVVCPNCKRALGERRDVVVATRACCYCGTRILKEPTNGWSVVLTASRIRPRLCSPR